MTQHHCTVTARYEMAPEALWEIIADHEGMERWMGVPVRVRSGDGGEGTIRTVRVGPLRFAEEILAFVPPQRMVYRVIEGLPIRYHQGEILIVPADGGGSELQWRVTMDSAIPGLARAMVRGVKRSLSRALRRLSA